MKSHIPHPILIIAALSCGFLHAEVKPNPLFTDGAVLQRGQAVPVWGTANDGERVSVEFAGQTVSTTAQGGKWRVELKALEAGGPFAMKISGDNKIEVKDLLVGEVWVCSGQSNMDWKFQQSASAAEERPKAKYPKLRMFTVSRTTSGVPLAEAKGSWVECSPETVNSFSAVGYFFARDLHEKLGVPVGMIHSSWGGTPAQAWTSIEGFGDAPELKDYAAKAQAAFADYPAAAATYPAKLAEYQAAKKTWDETTGKAFEEARKAWNQQAAEAKKKGQPVPPAPVPASKPPQGVADPNGGSGTASALYNGMIAPIVPYAIKGAIWYQGESNAGQSKQYRTLFPAMIADWRAKWNQGDFPFYFVQIAPFKGQPAEIREAQFLTLKQSPNTAMAVTTDVGDANDIHPKQKQPVGHRLALAARALAYGEKIEYSGPLYESMEVKGDKAAISFAHVGGGLVAKDGDLKGFTIAGADGKFVPAKAEIVGANVVVSAEGVANPKAVRYGWENVPDVNLYNKEDIPASPFRTDVD
jgi:sialate O-acetylesterase